MKKLKNFIITNVKKILIIELIFLLVSLLFFIKSCCFSLFPLTAYQEQTGYDILMTIWLYIAIVGALSFPFFLLQIVIFWMFKLEKQWKRKNMILFAISIIVFFFFIIYLFKDNQYRQKKRIEYSYSQNNTTSISGEK